MVKVCVMCGEEFEAKDNRFKLCSPECVAQSKKKYSKAQWERKKAAKQPYKYACVVCGTEFETSYKNKKYCSEDCKTKANKENYVEREPKIKICIVCGKEFVAKANARTCSTECREIRYKEHVLKRREALKQQRRNNPKPVGRPRTTKECKCIICGKTYTMPTYVEQKTCSRKCGAEYRKTNALNKPYTPRMPQRLREIKCEVCGAKFLARTGKAKYCSDCKTESQRMKKVVLSRTYRATKGLKKRQDAYLKGVNALADINAKARELGLTYGQYQARYGGY